MKIITTVGTSLATNIINPLRSKCNISDEEQKALECFSKIQQKDFKEKENYLKEYNFLKKFILKNIDFSEKTSAEVKSILALRKKYNDFLKIELIATDTIISPLCSEILKEILEENIENLEAKLDEKNIIKDLQVANYQRYKRGLINLINRLNEFAYNGEYFGEMILNITGGFKGVIPYMTIFGQVNNIPIFYIFEFTNSLISIPQIPISIDESLFEKYFKEFYLISNDMIEVNKFSKEFLKECENLIEIDDGLVYINALGKILWDKYRQNNFIFYTTEDIYNEILKQQEIQRILKNKFSSLYESKSESKNGHLVYDDGDNPNRIFYFKKGDDFYIYKTFEDHDKYIKYLNDNSKLNKNTFIDISELFKV